MEEEEEEEVYDEVYEDEDADDEEQSPASPATQRGSSPTARPRPGFSVAAAFVGGSAFELQPVTPVSLAPGVKAWTDGEWRLDEVPSQLLGGTLLRFAQPAFEQKGARFTVTADGMDARVYVAVEVPAAGPCVPGVQVGPGLQFAGALAAAPRWLPEAEGPTWRKGEGEKARGSEPSVVMFSTFAPQGVEISLPESPGLGGSSSNAAVVLVAVVPVTAGSFAVAVASSTGDQYGRTSLMQDGVVAWTDRDHRYIDVPEYLLGGVLFQGPYKDLPLGTELTVRANSCARVFIVVEKSSGGLLPEKLQAGGWRAESGAPRWHDMPTMQTFSRDCPAGWAVTVPRLEKAALPVFSLVVVPRAGRPTAPLEVSCGGDPRKPLVESQEEATVDQEQQKSNPLEGLELLPLAEGAGLELSGRGSGQLVQVPLWLVGATLVRPRAHADSRVFCLRAAAPSVFYAIVDASTEPKLLTGWEKRPEAPEWVAATPSSPSRPSTSLAVYARRSKARESLGVPELTDVPAEVRVQVLALVVKVDTEAFDACVETSSGLEYARTAMAETALAWSDRMNRLAWLPSWMNSGLLFRGPFDFPSRGLGTGTLKVRASGAFRIYLAVEADYADSAGPGLPGRPREGGFPEALAAAGWRLESGAPTWGDPASNLKVFSCRCAEGAELELPALQVLPGGTLPQLLILVNVVSVAASQERLAEELKQVFQSWDPDGTGGLRREDLVRLLTALCPSLGQARKDALLAQITQSQKPEGKGDKLRSEVFASRAGGAASGVFSYEDFIDKLFQFGALSEAGSGT